MNEIRSSRSSAREVVYKFLFARLFNGDTDGKFLSALSLEYKLNDNDALFAKKLASTVIENYEEFTNEIIDLSKIYSFDRIYSTGKCALFIGMAELKFFDDVPTAVAIDQAVSLVKKYSTESSLSFINGVLASYAKKVKGE